MWSNQINRILDDAYQNLPLIVGLSISLNGGCISGCANGSSSSAERSIARNSSLEMDRASSLWLLESDPTGAPSKEGRPLGSLDVHRESFDGDILFKLKLTVAIKYLVRVYDSVKKC